MRAAPGVVAHHAPGHTPGHYVVRITAGGQEACLLADAVHHPLRLNDTGISSLFDSDAAQALRAREELLARLAEHGVAVGTAHFPDPHFQRVRGSRDARSWTDA
ncbi:MULTISPECIES: hypothetical protein [unclassified Streptomyces]|uniref:hypothetical protein n=1 Tax=unclassified Streptomyces TaxID=2593676 RepID=UPI0016514486|nr:MULTISPECIES: hypothetical protein [unclassified Streptomyces]